MMNQLELVWELEKYNSMIDDCKQSLVELENSIKLIDKTKEYEELEIRAKRYKNKIEGNKSQIEKLERLLKDYNYTRKKIHDDLYGGIITDLKQLEHLSKERESLIERIDEVEMKILNLMDENDSLSASFKETKTGVDTLYVELGEIKKSVSMEIEDLQVKIEDAKFKRNTTRSNIDKSLLNRYEKIRSNKGKGIVEFSNKICGGCNVKIPVYLLRDLKKRQEIVYCESCGRLLYYKEEEESVVTA